MYILKFARVYSNLYIHTSDACSAKCCIILYGICDCRFPAAKFPVIALSSPPANFPVSKEDAYIQRYFKWSPAIRKRVLDFKRDRLDNQPYLAAHVRLADDWVSA